MKNTDLIKAFDSFNKFNILIIGDVMIDSYMWGKVDRISPEAPVPIVSSSSQESRLGGAANVALNVQALGANPILCSVIGNDDKKEIFLKLLKKRELTEKGIISDEKRITTVKTRIISDNHHLLRVDEENSHYLDHEIENKFIKHTLSVISKEKIHAIIFQDYDKGVITPALIGKITERANELNIPTLVDPKKRNFTVYKNCSLFKPNFKELTEGLNININKKDSEEIFKAALELHMGLHAKLIMITLSEAGVFISNKEEYENIPAQIRDIADVSGAGDTVISVASLCLAANLSIKDIASISNMAGGIVCEKAGVVPINKTILLQECQKFQKEQ